MNSRTSYYQLVYRGTSHDLPDGDTVLGRIGDFVIDDPSVDKNHARISIKGSVAEMVDLASERGTHFNGEALEPNKKVLVKQSGKIILGNVGVDLLFAERDQWAPIATARAVKKVLLWTSNVVAGLSALLVLLFLSQNRLPEGHIIVRQVVIVVVLFVVAGCIRAYHDKLFSKD